MERRSRGCQAQVRTGLSRSHAWATCKGTRQVLHEVGPHRLPSIGKGQQKKSVWQGITVWENKHTHKHTKFQ